MINITNDNISDIAIGNIPIDKAYMGSQLIRENKKELLYIHNPSTAYIDTGIAYGVVFGIFGGVGEGLMIGSSWKNFAYRIGSTVLGALIGVGLYFIIH